MHGQILQHVVSPHHWMAKKTNGLTEAREAEGYMHGQTLQHVVPPHHWMAYAVGITV